MIVLMYSNSIKSVREDSEDTEVTIAQKIVDLADRNAMVSHVS